MQVILKHIAQNTTYRELQLFLKSALEGGIFCKSGAIEHITVLAQKPRNYDALEFHAILNIEPEVAAIRIIEKLHGKPLNGHLIAVKEYIERSVNNGRGIIHTEDKNQGGQRVADRRDTKKLFRLITIDQLKDFTWPE